MHKNSFSVYRLLPILTIGLTAIPIGNLSPNSIHLYLKPAPFQVQESVKKDLERQSILKKKLENISAKGPAEMGRKLVKNGLKKFLPKICGFGSHLWRLYRLLKQKWLPNVPTSTQGAKNSSRHNFKNENRTTL